jgi:hypothetical protein
MSSFLPRADRSDPLMARSPLLDAAIGVLITVLSAWIFGYLETSERGFAATRPWEFLQLDEIPAVLLVLALCLIWYAGRPATKGTGAPLSDSSRRLEFPHNFNRISAPDANSCAGCHNLPFGIAGGGGDIVANVFVQGQRFDFARFDALDAAPAGGMLDESGAPASLQTVGNSRGTLGMFGSGFIEMLARQMTLDLQRIRNAVPPGGSVKLTAKGVSFGTLARHVDGRWDTSRTEGCPCRA